MIENMKIHQMDIKTTFLNARLLKKKFTWGNPKDSYKKEAKHLVCKLHKSLYGLKQSSRMWIQKFDAFF
jgi:hypothetical protein